MFCVLILALLRTALDARSMMRALIAAAVVALFFVVPFSAAPLLGRYDPVAGLSGAGIVLDGRRGVCRRRAVAVQRPAGSGECRTLPPTYSQYLGTVVGDGHCVALVQICSSVGHTSGWRRGDLVRGSYPPAACIIATFNEDGRYANATDGSSHAAILLGEEVNGLLVQDQCGSVSRCHHRPDIFQERGRRRVRRRGSVLPSGAAAGGAAWIKRCSVALVPMMVGTWPALAWSNSHTLALLSREYADLLAEQQHQRDLLEQRIAGCK